MAAFGNVYKITPEMFATWMEILKEIPRAVLWLIDDNTTTTVNLKAHANIYSIILVLLFFFFFNLHMTIKYVTN
jgi:hypothetical protein